MKTGKKRIVFQKNHYIVLAGDGFWLPIGWWNPDNGATHATYKETQFGTHYAMLLSAANSYAWLDYHKREDDQLPEIPYVEDGLKYIQDDFMNEIKAPTKKALKDVIDKKFKWIKKIS